MKVRRNHLLFGAALAVLLPAAPPALAQDADAGAEIVVTATKRAERLLDVPAAITAITSDQIETIGAHSTRDLVNFAPGVALQSDGFNNTVIIRGIAASGTVSTPLVGTIIDGVPYGSSSGVAYGGSSAINVNLSDVERVEVLKGPQGTLYGASAMGGLLSYVMKSSVPDAMEASGAVEVFDTRRGDMSYLVEGAIAAPIVADRVALRVSGFYNDFDGFIDNPRTGDRNADERTAKGGRIALNLRPTDTLQVDLSALYQAEKLGHVSTAYYNADRTPVVADYVSNAAVLARSKRDFQQYTVRINQELGFADLTSLTSWAKLENSLVADQTDTFFGPFFQSLNPAAQTVFLRNEPTTNKFTQELRLASANTTGIRWLVGGFYTSERSRLFQAYYGAGEEGEAVVAGLDPAVAVVVPSKYKEYAVFGNVTVPIGRLELTAGARYSHNDQQFQQNSEGPLAPILGLAPEGPLSKSDANRFDYLGVIKYQIGPSSMLYARIASGYRPGGPNTVFTGVPPSYAADELVNYEAGFKSSILDGKGSIELAAFYIDWKNIQVTAITAEGSGYFANGGKARSQGFELSANLRPVDGLSLTGSLAYTDAELREDIPSLSGKAGDRLVNSPRWSGSAVVDYRWPVGGRVTAFVGGNFQYAGSRTNAFPADPAQPFYPMKGFSQIDLRAGIETGPISVTAFVRNLADKRADLSAAYVAPVFQVAQLRPRQIGVRLAAAF